MPLNLGRLNSKKLCFDIRGHLYEASLEGFTTHVPQLTYCKSLIDVGKPPSKAAAIVVYKNQNTIAKHAILVQNDLRY